MNYRRDRKEDGLGEVTFTNLQSFENIVSFQTVHLRQIHIPLCKRNFKGHIHDPNMSPFVLKKWLPRHSPTTFHLFMSRPLWLVGGPIYDLTP